VNRVGLLAALDDGNVRAFLRVIREGESGQDADAYTICYGGSHFSAPPWEHPRKPITAGAWTSTAAGAYQFLAKTWDAVAEAYALEDFSPGNQDLAAVALIHGRKALEDVQAGRFEAAVGKCAKEWASLPGSPYGQPTMTMAQARAAYEAWGGTYEESQAPPAAQPDPFAFDPDSLATEHYDAPEVKPMAPIILPLLQIAAQLIPQLADKFGSGSEVSNRNIAAAKVIGDEIVKATNSPNLQAAVEQMQADPEALKAAKDAVAVVYPELFEAGGGGIKGARDAAAASEGDWKRSFVTVPFAVILMLVPMVYFVVWHVVTGTDWSQEIKASVVSAVISGVLFSIVSFALGTSYGSQRKTNILAGRDQS
jgi:muramidase (phage lysozyme)